MPYPILNNTNDTDTHPLLHNSMIDVKAHFGAKGDSTTNDSVAIQAAIDAATTSGGIVFFPPGTYLCNIVLKPRVQLVGSGMIVTVLKAPNSSNADVIKGLNFATLTGKAYAAGDYALGTYEAGVRTLTIDGNKSNQTAGYGIRIWGRAPRFEKVEVRNCKSGGIWTEFSDVDNFTDPVQVLEGYFTDIRSHHNDGDAWTHRGPHDSVAVGYTAWDNTGWALRNETVSGSVGGIMLFHPNSFLNATGSFYCTATMTAYGGLASAANVGVGFQLESGAGTSAIFGTIVSSHTTGMLLKAQNCMIDATFLNNGTAIQYFNTCGWNSLRVNGSGNTNVFNWGTGEGGPQHVVGKFNVGASQTLSSGASSGLSGSSTYDLRGVGAGGDFTFFYLPTSGLFNPNGYTPALPASNATMVVPDLPTTFSGLQTFNTGKIAVGVAGFYSGTGTPEGVITAVVGSLFLRTNGGANTTLYVKESGVGNTGWIAK